MATTQNTIVTEDTFKRLASIDVNEHTEKKDCGNGQKLTYLSWAWAWAEFKKVYPTATYEVVKFDGLPYLVDTCTGIIVYTRVTVGDLTHEMWLPVMDGANKAMKLEPYSYKVRVWDNASRTNKYVDKWVAAATMFDINKTVMRCLTKNLAMFGLGLYIYAGEDLPIQMTEDEQAAIAEEAREAGIEPEAPQKKSRAKKTSDALPPVCEQGAADQGTQPSPQKLTHAGMDTPELLQRIIDWVMRQPDTAIAKQKASLVYDWEPEAFDYVFQQVAERFAFINDLHGNN